LFHRGEESFAEKTVTGLFKCYCHSKSKLATRAQHDCYETKISISLSCLITRYPKISQILNNDQILNHSRTELSELVCQYIVFQKSRWTYAEIHLNWPPSVQNKAFCTIQLLCWYDDFADSQNIRWLPGLLRSTLVGRQLLLCILKGIILCVSRCSPKIMHLFKHSNLKLKTTLPTYLPVFFCHVTLIPERVCHRLILTVFVHPCQCMLCLSILNLDCHEP